MIDLTGAAKDMDTRASRWSGLLVEFPELVIVYKLLTRNPWAAKEAAKAIKVIIRSNPGKARPADEPLFRDAS